MMLLNNEMSRMCYCHHHRRTRRTQVGSEDEESRWPTPLLFVQATDAWELSHGRHINFIFPSQLIDVISSCMLCQYSTHCCTAQQPCVLLSHVCRLSPRPLPSPRDGPARRLGCTQALATEAAATAPLDESGAPAATRSGPAPGPCLEQRATSLLLATPRAGGLSPCAAASFGSPSVCT